MTLTKYVLFCNKATHNNMNVSLIKQRGLPFLLKYSEKIY